MGARQRAQHRTKHGKGSSNDPPWSQKKSNSSLKVSDLEPSLRHRALLQGWQDFANSSSSSPHNGFSMSQEARNTERHVFGWGAAKLRDQTISFVSAGHLVREEPATSEDNLDENTPVLGAPRPPSPAVEETEAQGSSSNEVAQTKAAEAPGGDLIVTVLSNSTPAVSNSYRARKESTSSSASDEVIFTGRSTPSAIPFRVATESKSRLQPSKRTPDKVSPAASELAKASSTPRIVQTTQIQPRSVNSRLRRRDLLKNLQKQLDDEEAIMQDYIENMAVNDEDEDEDDDDKAAAEEPAKPERRQEHYRYHNGIAADNIKIQTKISRPHGVGRNLDQVADWSSADLEDFDELSTTDDEITHIGQVLRQRTRPSGTQFLVTAVGKGASDAKWMAHERLTSGTALEEIRIFQEIQNIEFEAITSEDNDISDEDDNEEALEDLMQQVVSEEDENLRIMEHTSRMTDEQIARALAKQEELGIGGDDLILFDGQAGDDDSDPRADMIQPAENFIPFSTKNHVSNRTKTKHNRRHRDSFPSAAAFADALDEDPYGGFDIMDFDRPSLRPKRRGRKSDFPFELELEDDDLAEQLYSTWTKDRENKMARKQEKEDARQAALLVNSDRSEPAAIKAEIRRFLIEEKDTIDLAPMDSTMRAGVHRLAKALKLASSSVGKEGKGIGRYPVLTKTAYTPQYTLDTIWEIDNLLNLRKFFPRFGGGTPRGAKTTKIVKSGLKARGGGGVMSGATYSNGEVVGASAPEIGSDNKGRAMLEKMGWTSGMGIGAVGNKGSIEVIKHVVKTTKAGLG